MMKTFLPIRVGLLLFAASFWSGCANLCELRDDRTGQVIPANFVGVQGTLAKTKPALMPVVLRSVETVSCTNFDRVVFTFDGSVTPGYHLEYIDRPVRHCASGQVIPIAGDAWLEVRLQPAQGHDQGQSTIAERNRQLNYPNLKQLVETCDFEGHATWVLGVGSPNRFRLTELVNPARLVVDVKRTRP